MTAEQLIRELTQFVKEQSGLIGVVIGWLLAVGQQEIKEWLQRRAMRAALLAELKSNLFILPQKRDIIAQIIQHLAAGRLLPGESVRFATDIYTEHYPKLSWRYTDLERSSLHVIYEHLRVIDTTLSSYADHITGSLESAELNSIFSIYAARMKDIANLLAVTEKLISAHAVGKPKDVLHLSKDYNTLKEAKFKRP